MRKFWSTVSITGLLLALAVPATAQESGGPHVLEVGEMAPDFELTGSTRFGTLRDPVKLSDYHGKTVVLAFFFRARTRG